MNTASNKMITRWFPCAAVDDAVRTPEGSGLSEKALFTWFAARPVAQARAVVLTALLPDDESSRPEVEAAIAGHRAPLGRLADRIREIYPEGRPVILDVFSGRGMIPLEAARLGLTAVGVDISPVATLAGRLLADFPLCEWDAEPNLPFSHGRTPPLVSNAAERLVADVRDLLIEIGSRVARAVEPYYPRNPDGSFPWGYLWAVAIPCDGCGRHFPLIGSFTLRHPYRRTGDLGQSFRLLTHGDAWRVEVVDGLATQAPINGTAEGKTGKSARCPFCQCMHSLDAIKAKGAAGQYQDVPLLAADTVGETRKVFRRLRDEELEAALRARPSSTETFGDLSAIPDENIPPGNKDTVRASGYGYRSYGELMNARQTLHFVETVRAIRDCYQAMRKAQVSENYAAALTCYAAANMVRRIRRSTRGAKLQALGNPAGTAQNRNKVDNIFSEESKVSFQFDYFETGPGEGPGTWSSIAETGMKALLKHAKFVQGGKPAKLRQGSALALPYRDASVDAVITDPPYYNMIDYLDASDLFYVWLKRVLFDIVPDLFSGSGLQDKREEIIVKRGNAPGEHRTEDFYQSSLSKAFEEAKRVLRPDGTLVVVFGHSDPDAWKRLLLALKEAGFIVTSTWPSRTESANTGVASIKVTITIGCRVAPTDRPVATALQVEREVTDLVKTRVRDWERWGLALTDQMMAACGPAMEVYGRYSRILLPDNQEAPIDRYLTLARVAVRDATAMKVDSIPLETFDTITRFAIFWMRLYGRGNVDKGEARFLAEADHLRLSEIRKGLLNESRAGYRITLDPPARISGRSPVFDSVRAMIAAWTTGGTEAVAEVITASECSPADEHLWAIVSEFSRLLPQSDRDAKALAAIQRNRTTIEKLARAAGTSGTQDRPRQLALLPTDEE